MQTDTCICVFVKPPHPGKVKTRLIPALGAESAASLAEALFRDTWSCIESLSWAQPVAASTDRLDPKFLAHPSTEVWLQGDGDLGARIERILRRGLARTTCAMVLGADSPGIPRSFLEDAHEALRSADAVLGPCDDGGFYLLGVRDCAVGLLADIPWSQSNTFACTLDRLRERGLKTVVLGSWFDVDRPEDLRRMCERLAAGTVRAPHTARVVARLRELKTIELQSISSDQANIFCTSLPIV